MRVFRVIGLPVSGNLKEKLTSGFLWKLLQFGCWLNRQIWNEIPATAGNDEHELGHINYFQ